MHLARKLQYRNSALHIDQIWHYSQCVYKHIGMLPFSFYGGHSSCEYHLWLGYWKWLAKLYV